MTGWIQQIELDAILRAAPDGSTIHVPVAVGDFVPAKAPLAWVSPPPDDEACLERIRSEFALGDSRTMQSDVGFGILQMVDIALRALSPGLNDPNTANDMIVQLGAVLLALWEQPTAPPVIEKDGRRLVSRQFDHRDHLHAALDPIRHHGVQEPLVAVTLLRTLRQLESETDASRARRPDRTRPRDDRPGRRRIFCQSCRQ